MQKEFSILFLDDQPECLEPLADYLEEFTSFKVLGIAEDFKSARETLSSEKVDLLVCDVNLPCGDAFEFVASVTKLRPNVRIVFLSGYLNGVLYRKAFEAGSHGYFVKSAVGVTELSASFEMLIRGQNFFPSELNLESQESMMNSLFNAPRLAAK